MRVLSLFDGISCARVALERAGIEVDAYYSSEIDKYANQVSEKNYKDIIRLGDVTKIKGDFDDIDLIIGGSPCQDLSIAGKRKGLKGERSGLFFEFVRLIKELKPKFFILENVASMKKEWQEIMSEELWGVKPVMINAALVSAQQRKRLFWVGRLVGDSYKQVEIPQPEDRGILLKDILEDKVDKKYILSENHLNYVLNRPKNYEVKIDPDKTNTLRTNYGNARSNETYVSQKLNCIGDIGSKSQGNRVYSPNGKSVTLSANGGGRGATTGLYATDLVDPVALRNRGNGKKPEFNKTQKANSLTTVQTDSMVSENFVIRKLTPIECERLMCLNDGYTEGISNTQRYKMLGNAFCVDVVQHIIESIYKKK